MFRTYRMVFVNYVANLCDSTFCDQQRREFQSKYEGFKWLRTWLLDRISDYVNHRHDLKLFNCFNRNRFYLFTTKCFRFLIRKSIHIRDCFKINHSCNCRFAIVDKTTNGSVLKKTWANFEYFLFPFNKKGEKNVILWEIGRQTKITAPQKKT